MKKRKIHLYGDGSQDSQGRGGWGAVCLEGSTFRTESGQLRHMKSTETEVIAVLNPLKNIIRDILVSSLDIEISSDLDSLVDLLNGSRKTLGGISQRLNDELAFLMDIVTVKANKVDSNNPMNMVCHDLANRERTNLGEEMRTSTFKKPERLEDNELLRDVTQIKKNDETWFVVVAMEGRILTVFSYNDKTKQFYVDSGLDGEDFVKRVIRCNVKKLVVSSLSIETQPFQTGYNIIRNFFAVVNHGDNTPFCSKNMLLQIRKSNVEVTLEEFNENIAQVFKKYFKKRLFIRQTGSIS